MNIGSRGRAGAIALMILVQVSWTACAARHGSRSVAPGHRADWSAVEQLAPGRQVRVLLKNGSELTGAMRSVASDAVAIAGKGPDRSDRTIARTDIKVLAIRERATKRKATIGMVAGGAAGAVVGATAAKTNKGTWSAILASGWAIVGGLIGTSDGFFDRTDTVIFRTE